MTNMQKLKQELDNNLGKGKFQEVSAEASEYLRERILAGGEEVRDAADVLHGKQLGHPLHPVLTDITIGSWTLGVFFDVVALLTRSSQARKSGDALISLGTLAAVPTAISGVADFSGIKKDSAGYGAAHGI